jgi:hypothetical protein
VESSESCDSESSTEPEEDVVVGEDGNLEDGLNFEWYRDQNRQRSTQHKHQVSYKENLSDDDGIKRSRKRAKGSGSSPAANNIKNLNCRVGDLRAGSGEMPEHNHREQLHTWDIWRVHARRAGLDSTRAHLLVASCHVGVDEEGFQEKRAREMVHEDDLVAMMLSPESRTPKRSRPERLSTTTLGHMGGLVQSFGGGYFLKKGNLVILMLKLRVFLTFLSFRVTCCAHVVFFIQNDGTN